MLTMRSSRSVVLLSLFYLMACDRDQPLGPSGLPSFRASEAPSAVTAEAVSMPQDPSEDSRVGANAGLGLRLPLSDRAGLVFDARGFYFPEQVLEWRVVQTGGPVPLPPALLQSIQQQLEPVRFNPAY